MVTKKKLSGFWCLAIVGLLAPGVFAEPSASMRLGESKFKEHCAVCHPDGGNIMNPKKTLHKKKLAANKMASVAAITKNMRNPGVGMTRFDEKIITDKEAKAIAEYILKTF